MDARRAWEHIRDKHPEELNEKPHIIQGTCPKCNTHVERATWGLTLLECPVCHMQFEGEA